MKRLKNDIVQRGDDIVQADDGRCITTEHIVEHIKMCREHAQEDDDPDTDLVGDAAEWAREMRCLAHHHHGPTSLYLVDVSLPCVARIRELAKMCLDDRSFVMRPGDSIRFKPWADGEDDDGIIEELIQAEGSVRKCSVVTRKRRPLK